RMERHPVIPGRVAPVEAVGGPGAVIVGRHVAPPVVDVTRAVWRAAIVARRHAGRADVAGRAERAAPPERAAGGARRAAKGAAPSERAAAAEGATPEGAAAAEPAAAKGATAAKRAAPEARLRAVAVQGQQEGQRAHRRQPG